MASGKDLERTRVDLTVPQGRRMEAFREEYPPGAAMLHGRREDLEEMVQTGEVRAVGRFREMPGGGYALPAVYVSKRRLPFYARHRKGLLITGSVLTLLSALALLILWTGPLVFFGGVAAAALFIAFLTRVSRGGGRSVSVTTTTTTKVRVR